jgi:hypothetical protein
VDEAKRCPCVYRVTGESFVTLYTEDGMDIGKGLVEDGLLLVDRKGGRKLANLVRNVAPSHHLPMPVFIIE